MISDDAISSDVRLFVEMALQRRANIDVVYEAGGDVRVSIYPPEPPAVALAPAPSDGGRDQ